MAVGWVETKECGLEVIVCSLCLTSGGQYKILARASVCKFVAFASLHGYYYTSGGVHTPFNIQSFAICHPQWPHSDHSFVTVPLPPVLQIVFSVDWLEHVQLICQNQTMCWLSTTFKMYTESLVSLPTARLILKSINNKCERHLRVFFLFIFFEI